MHRCLYLKVRRVLLVCAARDGTQRRHPEAAPRGGTQRRHPETAPRDGTQRRHPDAGVAHAKEPVARKQTRVFCLQSCLRSRLDALPTVSTAANQRPPWANSRRVVVVVVHRARRRRRGRHLCPANGNPASGTRSPSRGTTRTAPKQTTWGKWLAPRSARPGAPPSR